MPTSYALLSTYPPTQCGLATFTAALLTHLGQPGGQVAVVRVLEEPQAPPATPSPARSSMTWWPARPRARQLRPKYSTARFGDRAARVRRIRGPDGQDVISLLEALQVPSIVVLHTVLAHPTPRQRMILDEVIGGAGVLVTMTRTARSRLLDIYGTDPGRSS